MTMINKRNIIKDNVKKRKNIAKISSDNSLDHYLNPKNIPNQKLVKETIEYFEKGAGSRAFSPLVFLNLLDKQYHFVVDNIEDPNLILTTLKGLPLSNEEHHILYGLIIKWFGGYPVSNMNEVYDFALKLIEKEFLGHSEETPEKEFCKADMGKRNHLTKMAIALTTAINNDIDVRDILEAMPDKKTSENTYKSFDQLFDDTYKTGVFGDFVNNQVFLIERTRHEFQFTVWLQENKGLEYNNRSQYERLLSVEIFNEYLRDEAIDQQGLLFLNSYTGNEGFRIFTESYSKLRSKFRVKRAATKQDCVNFPLLKEGDVLQYDPDYKTNIEAFMLLTSYYAVAYLELEKHLFIEKYKVCNEHTIRAEICELEAFITESKKISLSEACSNYGKWGGSKWEYIYLRFASGFYENLEVDKYPTISAIGNDEARVYGKYFLFYELLKSNLKSQSSSKIKEEKSHAISRENNSTQQASNRLTIKTYALMHVYLDKFGGKGVTQQNKDELAVSYGHSSGVQLRNDFMRFKNDDHRLDLSTSNRRSANTHIDRFKEILPILKEINSSAYSAAQNDLATLQRKYDAHFI